MNSLVLRIGGEAGWGIATAAEIWARISLKLGYHVFSSKEYASQIRGGHNYHTVRASREKVAADVDKVDVLLALDQRTLREHRTQVSPSGLIFFDRETGSDEIEGDQVLVSVPVRKISAGKKTISNLIFLGAAAKCLGVNFKILSSAIEESFEDKPDLISENINLVRLAYDSAEEKMIFPAVGDNFNCFLNGNDAIVQGALKAGLKFHVQYPMTPVSGILHHLAKEALSNKELMVIQPEDEIAGINLAIGASYAGARAMVATSGGGFSLMVEGLGLAGMAEIPLVIIEGQRPGPATGLPTKTEQGDLKFVLSAAPGEFPRVVIAPGDVEECYTETKRAFYLAEKYQLPVIVLLDKHVAESFKDVNLAEEERNFNFDFGQRINILEKVSGGELSPEGLYPRYRENNLLRTLPGTPQGIFTSAGDEHDEVGQITEDPEIRKKMVERRMGKLRLIAQELPPPVLLGPNEADWTVVSWGSQKGAIQEVVKKMNAQGKKVNSLLIKCLLPFPDREVKMVLERAKRLFLVENNYSGQLGELIREKTGLEIKERILRYDGLPFTADELYAEMNRKW